MDASSQQTEAGPPFAPPPGYAPEVGDSVSHDGCHPVRLTMLSERLAVVVVNGREHTLCRDEYLDMTRRAIAKGAVLKRSHNEVAEGRRQ